MFAFARGAAVTCVPRLIVTLSPHGAAPLGREVWNDTRIVLPDARPLRDVFTGAVLQPIPADGAFTQPVKAGHNAFLYVYEGGVEVGPAGSTRALKTHSAGVLVAGDRIEVKAGPEGARFILLAGRPLNEPVVQYGPFVMNTREEIEQAIRDYQAGELALPQ